MHNIRCFENFKDDRMCDICKFALPDVHEKCKSGSQNKFNKELAVKLIGQHCPNRKTAYDEYIPFDACAKDGRTVNRRSKECSPSLECVKYISDERRFEIEKLLGMVSR